MEIIKGYDVHPANYNKKTPETLKRIADVLLLSMVAIDPILQTQLPEFKGKEWIILGWNIFVTLFKLFSKTVTEKTE
jgi:hypothetical protein